MYYIGTQQECINYDVFVTQNENYPYNDNWANPIEIEGNWYILKHEDYECNLPTVNELPQIEEDV